jgi:hypothetical protein
MVRERELKKYFRKIVLFIHIIFPYKYGYKLIKVSWEIRDKDPPPGKLKKLVYILKYTYAPLCAFF